MRFLKAARKKSAEYIVWPAHHYTPRETAKKKKNEAISVLKKNGLHYSTRTQRSVATVSDTTCNNSPRRVWKKHVELAHTRLRNGNWQGRDGVEEERCGVEEENRCRERFCRGRR